MTVDDFGDGQIAATVSGNVDTSFARQTRQVNSNAGQWSAQSTIGPAERPLIEHAETNLNRRRHAPLATAPSPTGG